LLPFAAGTLQSMASPHYIERTVTFNTKRERLRLQNKVEVHGEPARLLRRATTIMQSIMWPKRLSHNECVGMIAKDWMLLQSKTRGARGTYQRTN
jgi:hypothetical protein